MRNAAFCKIPVPHHRETNLFTTCSTSSLSMSSTIWGDPSPSGVRGGVEGEGTAAGEGGARCSDTGPLLVVSPLATVGAQ